jgi:hypothetical protein
MFSKDLRGTHIADNEYFQNGYGQQQYFADLEKEYRDSGIVVPLTYNDGYQGQNFVNGTVSTISFCAGVS